MESRLLKPYALIFLLMALTSLALAYSVDVDLTDEAGIRLVLPDRVGSWTGQEVRYCQNPACQQELQVGDLADRDACPECGSPLQSMSMAERSLLPVDTVLLRKRYYNAAGQIIHVSIVLSGKERASIHRPQVCLRGQGRSILREFVMPIPLPDRDPLEVMVLDLEHKISRPGFDAQPALSYYAYWFVGKNRETPRHLQRMIWMGIDRVFHNVAHRWAYISVGGGRQPDSEAYTREIRDFVSQLYPQMVLN